VVNLLKRIAASTQSPVWAARAERFDGYLTQPPLISLTGPTRPVRKQAAITIWVSKLSRVSVRIAGATSSMTLSRGSHTFYWSAKGRRPGHYAVKVSATDLAGNKAAKGLRLVVRK
jgi:hypothetical protein